MSSRMKIKGKLYGELALKYGAEIELEVKEITTAEDISES